MINKLYLFIWDRADINFCQLCDEVKDSNFKLVGFQSDPNDHVSFIKDVRVGYNPQVIAIVVNQSEKTDYVIVWDL